MTPPPSIPTFEEAYAGTPPWDIGHPQPEVVRLVEAGELLKGDVLDVGCGTGENALYLAQAGSSVLGIDSSPTAIERARKKAAERGISASFLLHDALDLPTLGRSFDAVLDSGLFHAVWDDAIPRFVEGLRRVLRPGGTYHLLCFSTLEPNWGGPRRVSQAEIRSTFAQGWRIDSIREGTFENLLRPEGVRAWVASITHLAGTE